MPKAELVTSAEFAKRMNLSRNMVSRAKAQGVFEGALVDQPGKKRKLLTYKLAVKYYNSRLDPAFRKARQTPQKKAKGGNGKPAKASGEKSFADARADVERLKADELRFKSEERKGLWVKKADVADKAFRAARLMRDSLLNIPARISALVASESEQSQCYRIVHDEIKQALDEFVRQLKTLRK